MMNGRESKRIDGCLLTLNMGESLLVTAVQNGLGACSGRHSSAEPSTFSIQALQCVELGYAYY